MINYIKGKLIGTKTDMIILESNSIGYEIYCSVKDISLFSGKKGTDVQVFTYLVHREDAMILYGFAKESEKLGFIELLRVDGIGAKLGIKILSFYDSSEIFKKVHSEDIEALKKIPGVGPKMAQKMIFELKGKLPENLGESLTSIEKDLIQSLLGLGYQEQVIREQIKNISPLSDNFEVEFKKLLKQVSGKTR